MNINNVVVELIKLALSVPDKSIYARLKETGYFEIHDKISVSDIRKTLEEDTYCNNTIKSWMQYSEDKRCSSGWYFVQKTSTEYIVGYINEKGVMGLYEEKHENSLEACSSFIKHEIDEIRETGDSWVAG